MITHMVFPNPPLLTPLICGAGSPSLRYALKRTHLALFAGGVGLKGADEGNEAQTAEVAANARQDRDGQVWVGRSAACDDSGLNGNNGRHLLSASYSSTTLNKKWARLAAGESACPVEEFCGDILRFVLRDSKNPPDRDGYRNMSFIR